MRLSVIIPTIGRETLNPVLEGIIQSTDYEAIKPQILVVWDGERKHKLPIDPYKHDIKILETAEKKYAGGARNRALDYVTGDVVVFISDDTIPTPNWLSKVYKFHVLHPQKEKALLGKISWIPQLAKDPFHAWLENHGQFAFSKLENLGKKELENQAYRFFYTSNVSVKRELIGTDRFNLDFKGWGFEDSEFGYRLSQKGMLLHYDKSCEVLHDHELTLENLKRNTANAKKNAEIFESLHPEVKIRPSFFRREVIILALIFSWPLSFISKKIYWWREWKKSWVL